jgi:hypothetical protein
MNPVDQGFGAEVRSALRQRQRWLVDNGHMSQRGGQLVAKRRLLETLTRNDVALAGKRLGKEFGRSFREEADFDWKSARSAGSIRLASGRFAIVQKGKEFTLVPWRQAMRMRRSGGIGIDAKKAVSR